MALKFNDTYTPKSNAPDADYPQGSFKNGTGAPGDKSGTPYEKAWTNDILGFLQKLIDVGAITPNNVSDTVQVSQYYEGLTAHTAQLISTQNFIINGGCMIEQRAPVSLVNGVFEMGKVDRFDGEVTGTTATATLGQLTGSSLSRTGRSVSFSAINTTGAGFLRIRHRIESKNALKFKDQKGSFSCRINHDKGSDADVTIIIRKANALGDFSAVTIIDSATPIPVVTATDTLIQSENIAMGDPSNGIEIEVLVDIGDMSGGNVEFAELQLEVGEVATLFRHLDHAQDLALCQRYFYKSFNPGTDPASNTGTGDMLRFAQLSGPGVTALHTTIYYPVLMRITPTMTSYNPAAAGSEARNVTANLDYTATDLERCGASGVTVLATSPAGGTQFQRSGVHFTADAEFPS